MTNEEKRVFAELLGFKWFSLEAWENGGFFYRHMKEIGEDVGVENFNPESDEYYWKILEALVESKSNVHLIESALVEKYEYPLDNFIQYHKWYNTHREEVLEAILEVTSE